MDNDDIRIGGISAFAPDDKNNCYHCGEKEEFCACVICPWCEGAGEKMDGDIDFQCQSCDGDGVVSEICPWCEGTGEDSGFQCPSCDGDGVLRP